MANCCEATSHRFVVHVSKNIDRWILNHVDAQSYEILRDSSHPVANSGILMTNASYVCVVLAHAQSLDAIGHHQQAPHALQQQQQQQPRSCGRISERLAQAVHELMQELTVYHHWLHGSVCRLLRDVINNPPPPLDLHASSSSTVSSTSASSLTLSTTVASQLVVSSSSSSATTMTTTGDQLRSSVGAPSTSSSLKPPPHAQPAVVQHLPPAAASSSTAAAAAPTTPVSARSSLLAAAAGPRSSVNSPRDLSSDTFVNSIFSFVVEQHVVIKGFPFLVTTRPPLITVV
jgi:hypothetical protein